MKSSFPSSLQVMCLVGCLSTSTCPLYIVKIMHLEAGHTFWYQEMLCERCHSISPITLHIPSISVISHPLTLPLMTVQLVADVLLVYHLGYHKLGFYLGGWHVLLLDCNDGNEYGYLHGVSWVQMSWGRSHVISLLGIPKSSCMSTLADPSRELKQ